MTTHTRHDRESQRDSATKPRVARNELPWEKRALIRTNPERVVPLKTGTQTQGMTNHTRQETSEAWRLRFPWSLKLEAWGFPWSLSTLRGIPVRRLARIPTGFRNKAQGCLPSGVLLTKEGEATLGKTCLDR